MSFLMAFHLFVIIYFFMLYVCMRAYMSVCVFVCVHAYHSACVEICVRTIYRGQFSLPTLVLGLKLKPPDLADILSR